MSKKIKPVFNKKIPKNAKHYFNPASDNKFKSEHPIAYTLLVLCGITALLMPLVVYGVLTTIYKAPESGWKVLGYIGSFIIGIGLFNIVAAWIGQYLGHLVTGLCIGVGSLLVGASVLLLYNPHLYNAIDQETVSYYFINILFLCTLSMFYLFFRGSINGWLRSKRISHSTIRKLKKGRKNFWQYKQLNEEYNMGLVYYINFAFTVTFPMALIMNILFGWIKVVSIPISILLIFSCILISAMNVFSKIQSNIKVHGKPFILIGRSYNGGIDCFMLDLMYIGFPLAIAYTELLIMFDLWHITQSSFLK